MENFIFCAVYSYGTRNQEGTRIPDLCAATDLVVTNPFFRKRISQTNCCCAQNSKSHKKAKLYGCKAKVMDSM